ncbi:FbpB family small basic protein [Oceanobacillus saliphilus]|uniref:FbpB family small basic protein n=1 Tax=Oceanobacillus saliphilus TaxID=2925834 RepID=UPI00201D8926|nr:FbpB family small basic protein [Oceanobacillus saliphilus]
MRPKTLNFEQLVKQNRQELLNDEESITQIELRLEKKQEALAKKQRKELEINK